MSDLLLQEELESFNAQLEQAKQELEQLQERNFTIFSPRKF